uniref:Uncharacterized protein n=1 Tax=Anguilla anguilla TaxID=7936 RepID=A0A0E9XF93_ANGAN
MAHASVMTNIKRKAALHFKVLQPTLS